MKTKITAQHLNNLAEKWSGAYRGDFQGRAVSMEIIRALLDYGFSEEDAEQVYRSKHIRWFFDSQNDKAFKSSVAAKFTAYLKKNIQDIRVMFTNEFGRTASA